MQDQVTEEAIQYPSIEQCSTDLCTLAIACLTCSMICLTTTIIETSFGAGFTPLQSLTNHRKERGMKPHQQSRFIYLYLRTADAKLVFFFFSLSFHVCLVSHPLIFVLRLCYSDQLTRSTKKNINKPERAQSSECNDASANQIPGTVDEYSISIAEAKTSVVKRFVSPIGLIIVHVSLVCRTISFVR